MGTFKYPVIIYSRDKRKREKIEALVDAGATYTWIPSQILKHLGYKPEFKRKLKLADGKVIERKGTIINIKINKFILPTIAIFGDSDSQPLLGAVTLEEFSLAPDPISKKLVPIEALLMSFINSEIQDKRRIENNIP